MSWCLAIAMTAGSVQSGREAVPYPSLNTQEAREPTL